MRVAVIADAHLGGPGGAAAPLLRQLEEVAATGCRRLLFLGDLFHVWVGHPSYETPEVTAVVDCLRGWPAPHNPGGVVSEMADLLRQYS